MQDDTYYSVITQITTLMNYYQVSSTYILKCLPCYFCDIFKADVSPEWDQMNSNHLCQHAPVHPHITWSQK